MNHKKASVLDQIALIGELEHIRFHALRSMKTTDNEDKKFFYAVTAHTAQKLRREYMMKHFVIDEKDWCLLKASARLKQLTDELAGSDQEEYANLQNLADGIIGKAVGEDLFDCESCLRDMELIDAK